MAPRTKSPAAPALATFAARLLHARTVRGRSARDLSLSVELSPAAVYFMEGHPESDVKLSSLTRLARELDVHPAWLAWGLLEMDGFPAEIDAT